MSKELILAVVGLAILTSALFACRTSQRDVVDGALEHGVLLEDVAFTHGQHTRTYHFYQSRREQLGPKPLVLLLHGGGATIDNHIGVRGARWSQQVWIDIAEEEGVHVAVPQGLDNHWNDCRADCSHCGEQDDVGFLTALIDEIDRRYDVDRGRVYVVGESNGGYMTQRLAQERPELFAGMGVVISLMPADNKCQQRDAPIPIMYQVGTADSGVKYEGGSSGNSGTNLSARESIAYWVEHNQCETAPVSSMVEDGPYDDRSTITLELYDCPTTRTKVGIYHMHGAGHVPPSIDVQVSEAWESLAGVQNHDLESARAFWSFLKEFEH